MAGSATVNFVFDRYISTKSELRGTTMRNYKYMYDRFIRNGFGRKSVSPFLKTLPLLSFLDFAISAPFSRKEISYYLKIDRMVLVDLDIFDQYLESFRVK